MLEQLATEYSEIVRVVCDYLWPPYVLALARSSRALRVAVRDHHTIAHIRISRTSRDKIASIEYKLSRDNTLSCRSYAEPTRDNGRGLHDDHGLAAYMSNSTFRYLLAESHCEGRYYYAVSMIERHVGGSYKTTRTKFAAVAVHSAAHVCPLIRWFTLYSIMLSARITYRIKQYLTAVDKQNFTATSRIMMYHMTRM